MYTDTQKTELLEIAKTNTLTVEECGSWLWVTGNTYSIRKDLSKIGLKFSRKKSAWYLKGNPSRSKKSMPLEWIRSHYGASTLAGEEREQTNNLYTNLFAGA
jgi:hypothetical protein